MKLKFKTGYFEKYRDPLILTIVWGYRLSTPRAKSVCFVRPGHCSRGQLTQWASVPHPTPPTLLTHTLFVPPISRLGIKEFITLNHFQNLHCKIMKMVLSFSNLICSLESTNYNSINTSTASTVYYPFAVT